jgi:glycolate oxidase FAD binding subunit
MVATGLSGPARASAGAVRDYVLGARFINGRGEHLTFGGQVMKNVAGYDVSRLVAGSWGTLGVLTEVSLKVLSFAPCEATLVCDLAQAPALDLLQRWGGQPLPLNASCWVHDGVDGAAGNNKLFVRLRGATAAVQAALPRMRADVLALGGDTAVMDNAQAGPDWAAARDQRLPFFSVPPAPDLCLWRLSVAQTTPVLDLPFAQFIEWHGGQRWLWAPAAAAAQLHALAPLHHGALVDHRLGHAVVRDHAGLDSLWRVPVQQVTRLGIHRLGQSLDPGDAGQHTRSRVNRLCRGGIGLDDLVCALGCSALRCCAGQSRDNFRVIGIKNDIALSALSCYHWIWISKLVPFDPGF